MQPLLCGGIRRTISRRSRAPVRGRLRSSSGAGETVRAFKVATPSHDLCDLYKRSVSRECTRLVHCCGGESDGACSLAYFSSVDEAVRTHAESAQRQVGILS